jgi:hypothetical protein
MRADKTARAVATELADQLIILYSKPAKGTQAIYKLYAALAVMIQSL